MGEERGDEPDEAGHVSMDQKWQKAAAIATVLTLVSSTLIGGYGVFLGSRALEAATSFESLKVRPLFEYTYSTWMEGGATVSFTNLGFGPGVIKDVTAYYENAVGQAVWFSYGSKGARFRNDQPLNLWTYLGVPAVNEGPQSPLLANWPWYNSIYGPGESVKFVTVPPIESMPADWRNRYEVVLTQAISTLRICFVYESLDGVSINDLIQGKCHLGPQRGDIVYRGGEEFIVLDESESLVELTDFGYVAVVEE